MSKNDRRTLTYCGRKMVLTLGSTFYTAEELERFVPLIVIRKLDDAGSCED